MTLAYVTSAPLPTQKAHGAQIAHMCEAFSELGLDVELWHAERGVNHPLENTGTRSFYDLDDSIAVRSLPRRILRWGRKLTGAPLPSYLYWLQSFIWSATAAVRAAARGSEFTCFTRHFDVAFWMSIFGVRTILEVHNVPQRIGRRLLRFATHRPEVVLVVCLTAGIRDKLVALGVPAPKCSVEPDAVDLDRFRSAPPKKACREQFGLPRNRAIVGYVGRFTAMGIDKGIATLVRAIAGLHEGPGIVGQRPLLLCVGGPMEPVADLRKLGFRLGLAEQDMKFVDHVPMSEVPTWIKACDVATIPLPWTEWSAYYTSPLKLFEYMAAGVPIVASDLPSIREILTHEETAFLAPPGDIEHWTENIERALVPESDLAENANRLVMNFTWNTRAKRICCRVTGLPKRPMRRE